MLEILAFFTKILKISENLSIFPKSSEILQIHSKTLLNLSNCHLNQVQAQNQKRIPHHLIQQLLRLRVWASNTVHC